MTQFILKLLLFVGSCWCLTSCSRLSLLVFIKPAKKFNEHKIPAPPDYQKNKSWHQWARRDADKKVDVFYLHPTTYIVGKGWNQDLDDAHVNWRTKVLPINYQASVFYDAGRMFIPKYRQAIFYSFVDKKDNGKKALELAYEDVRNAFYYYWEHHNQGRPFIFAAHSQGAYHSQKLLAEILQDSAIRTQLVIGYVIGWPIPEDYVLNSNVIEICSTATQTGCIVSWNTEGQAPKLSLVEKVSAGKKIICVNPLSWKTDTSYVSKNQNLGALQYNKHTKKDEIILYYCDAAIRDGALRINEPANQVALQMPMGKGNYHLYDYSFFYQNIKQNIKTRIASYYNRIDSTQLNQ
ncbi:DUF3089 domain-containing protein [Aureispira anguillae]|uniref:DUF3089 domain-containing protein n=1 Tax=Aureispira anguillae TaxID=2864201 RepID=A0A915YIV7_9BACT|nr:DUF3089 domain-containing protein [Aureispira anguillae]BDS13913.1 DUF3089 domain-containing protein [Aureispira anguillae]